MNKKISPLFCVIAYKLSNAIHVLSELGIFDFIKARPSSVGTIARSLNIDELVLADVLTILNKFGLVTHKNNIFSLPNSIENLLEMFELERLLQEKFDFKNSLKDRLLNKPPNNPLTWVHQNSSICDLYQRAMSKSARSLALHIVRSLKQYNMRHVFDLGGADGALVEALEPYYASCNFTIVDMPEVEEFYNKRYANHLRANKFNFIGCNLLGAKKWKSNIPDHENCLIIVSNVLHLLNKDEQKTLLTTILHTLNNQSRVLIYDQFVNQIETLDPSIVLALDWVNYGTPFMFCENEYAKFLDKLSYKVIDCYRHPSLPGAIIIAQGEKNIYKTQ